MQQKRSFRNLTTIEKISNLVCNFKKYNVNKNVFFIQIIKTFNIYFCSTKGGRNEWSNNIKKYKEPLKKEKEVTNTSF